MENRFFVGKLWFCLLSLLWALCFVRISYSDTCDSGASGNCGCPYSITDENGDGTVETLTIGNGTACTIASNDYTKTAFYPWSNSGGTYHSQITTIRINGNVKTGIIAYYLFANMSNVTNWSDLAKLDVSETTYFNDMFLGFSFTDVNALSGWKVDNAVNMQDMFRKCSSLNDLSALSGWKVSNVKSMLHMFDGCSALKNLTGLGNWDVSSLEDTLYMFRGCSSLNDLSALSGWKVSNLKETDSMFKSCSALNNLTGLGSWDVSNVESMTSMFYDCTSLNDLSALSGWKVSNVTNMFAMFFNCDKLNNLTGLGSWDVSNVESMQAMFRGCSSLNDLSALSGWKVSNVKNMSNMFFNCQSIKRTALPSIGSWAVGNVTDMSNMFEHCIYLTNLDGIKDWDVSNVKNMSGMFKECVRMNNPDGIKGWDVRNVTDMSYMFYNCSSVATLPDISGWDVSNVTNMTEMFSGCTGFTKVNFLTDTQDNPSKWDFSKSGLTRTKMLLNVGKNNGTAVNLDQYYTDMKGTKLYVYGKHSYRDFGTDGDKTDLTSDPTNLVFEPYTVTVTYTGGTGSSSISGASNQHTAAEAYYDAVVDWKGSDLYDAGNYYFKYDGGGTLTFTPATGYIIQSVTLDEIAQPAPYSVTLSNITADHAIEVMLQTALATVTYSAGDGTGTPPVPYEGHYFDTITLPSGEGLSKPGYGFAGWSDGSNTYKAGDSYTVNAANVTMSAVYDILYKVTYAAGDAETGDVPAEESYVAGDTVIVKGNTGNLARPGYSFAGWSDGTNPPYAAGSDFEMPDKDVTLTAQFTQNPAYTLTFAKETDVSGDIPAAISVVAGTTTKLPTQGNLTKPGYSFAGWSDGTNPPYAAESDFTMPGNNITLTAAFTQNPSYTLTFAKETDVSGDVPAAISVVAGTTTPLPAQGNLTKTGYSFAGWSDDEYTYAAGAAFTMPFNNVTLTAAFTQNPSFTLTFAKEDSVSGDVPAAVPVIAGITTSLPAQGNLTKTGYSFAGWSDGEYTYAAGAAFTMPFNHVTLTAVFNALPTYTLSYIKDTDVTGTLPAAAPYWEGATVTVAGGETLSKAGYVFAGWSDGTTTYAAGETFTMPDKDVTLKAVFEKVYTLTYVKDADVSGDVPAAAAYKAGAAVTVPDGGNLTKSGSLFSGWFDGTKTYAAGTVFPMPDHDMTLTAKFTKDTAFYTLTFAKESGVSGDVPESMKVSSGILVALPAQGDLAKTGFYFAGWSDGTTIYAAGGCYLTVSRNITLTAVFKEIQPYQADYALNIHAAQTAKYPEAGNAQISYDPSKI